MKIDTTTIKSCWNWTAIASIATLLAVIVALIPLYKELLFRSKKKKATITKLRLIIEDLMFLVDTEDHKLDFLPKFYAEIDTILTHSEHKLSYILQDKIIHLLFLMRINDKTEEYHTELQEYVDKTHKCFADLDESKEK